MPEKKSRILVAEDEKPIAHALELKLTSAGFNVTVVGDGEAALEAIATSNFDLIILDIMMPKKNGFEVLQALKDKQNKTPVTIASNLGQPEDLARAKALGAKDYFIKSDTSLAGIIEHVKSLLEK